MIHHSAGGAHGVIAPQLTTQRDAPANLCRGLQKLDGKVCGEEDAA